MWSLSSFLAFLCIWCETEDGGDGGGGGGGGGVEGQLNPRPPHLPVHHLVCCNDVTLYYCISLATIVREAAM